MSKGKLSDCGIKGSDLDLVNPKLLDGLRGNMVTELPSPQSQSRFLIDIHTLIPSQILLLQLPTVNANLSGLSLKLFFTTGISIPNNKAVLLRAKFSFRKAQQIWPRIPQYQGQNPPNFSTGWPDNFKRRHNIKQRSARKVARWFVQQGILQQFNTAKEIEETKEEAEGYTPFRPLDEAA